MVRIIASQYIPDTRETKYKTADLQCPGLEEFLYASTPIGIEVICEGAGAGCLAGDTGGRETEIVATENGDPA